MQVECIKAFGGAEPGDVVEVPDGAAVDPEHWRPAGKPPPPPPPAAAAVAPVAVKDPAPKEGM